MSTRYVDYSDILNGSAALAGLGPSDIGLGEFALFRAFHDRRLAQAWEANDWPDVCRVEQRTFRPEWLAANTYAATEEVYDPPSGQYYQSMLDGNINNPPTVSGVENSQFWALCSPKYTALPWVSGADYAVGAQLVSPDDRLPYQCCVAHTSGVSFDITKFGRLTEFNRYISADQVKGDGSLETPIGELFRAYDKDPRLTTKLVDLPFWQSNDGWQFVQLRHNFSFLWLHFRTRRPLLAGDAWDENALYGVGQGIYYVGTGVSVPLGVGNFYVASLPAVARRGPGRPPPGRRPRDIGSPPPVNPETAPDYWDVVRIPYIFRGFLIGAGYADWLKGDGQTMKAGQEEGNAYNYLEMEADKLQRQQGQVQRLRWST